MTEPLEFGEAYFKAIADGKEHRVTEDVYDYFLDVLPPVMMGSITYQGKVWSFGFAEGYDNVTLFRQDRTSGEYFAQATPWLNPREAGSIESQKNRWVMNWLKLGKQNPWIREAEDPPFNTQSFHECQTDKELLDKFEHGNWCTGQAFFVGNLCFINQVNGGDEWLTIKDGTPFESISFGYIIKHKGTEEAQKLIDDIRASTVEQCKNLEYRGR
jgi:hypothetical protein